MADIQESTISELREKDREHDSRLDSLTTQNQTQEFKLKSQVAKDKEHDFRLNSLANKNDAQDEELHRQATKDSEHDLRFDALEEFCKSLEHRIENLGAVSSASQTGPNGLVENAETKCCCEKNVLSIVALVVSVVSLILHFVL